MDDRRGMYAFFGILIAFKIWTLILIFTVTSSWGTVAFLLGSHVLWFGVAALIIWTPAAFWLRLLRVRAKRKRLQSSEWNVDQSEHTLRK